MKEKRSFWIVGGDLRQIKLAELLLEDGHQVQTYAVEQRPDQGKLPGTDTLRGIEEADCVILPLPVMAEHGILNSKLSDRRVPLQMIFQNLRPGQLVCAGKAPPEVRAMAEQAEVVFFDYFAREELEIANAVPTVEGAIQIAMEELPTTLFGTRVLVLGFGRLGKLMAHRLKGLGANVTVAARSYGDLAWIEAYGYQSERIEQLDGWLGGYQLVINTVPARVLDRAWRTWTREPWSSTWPPSPAAWTLKGRHSWASRSSGRCPCRGRWRRSRRGRSSVTPSIIS